MAKKKAFEETLSMDFRWPQKGEQPFRPSENASNNAFLAPDVHSRLSLMTDGYLKAANLAVDSALSEGHSRDFLVFPIIFNYRQFLELSLKSMLFIYGSQVGIEPNWKTHDLIVLWSDFSLLLKRYGTPDPDEADPVVAQIIAEFSKIDPLSFSYRYPVDTKGNPIPLAHELLDLGTLRDVMEGVGNYFTGCDGFLDSLEREGEE